MCAGLPFLQSLLPIHSPTPKPPPPVTCQLHTSFLAPCGLDSLHLPRVAFFPLLYSSTIYTIKMLSAPVKSAKRISSLFSLGSKDRDSHSSPTSSPVLKSAENSSIDKRRRSSSRPTRHVSAPNGAFGSEPRTMPDNLDLESLPPPPSLLAVNQDLANSVPSSPTGRPQSRGRDMSRPSSSAGLAIPGSNPDSRPSTPSKRRSWMPGRSRASSVDKRPTPLLPAAWIAGLDQKVVYDLGPLSSGEQVCTSKLNMLSMILTLTSRFLVDLDPRTVERAR